MHEVIFNSHPIANLKLWGTSRIHAANIRVWANKHRIAGLEFDYQHVRNTIYLVTFIGSPSVWTRAEFREYAALIQLTSFTHEQEARLKQLQDKIEKAEQFERGRTRIKL